MKNILVYGGNGWIGSKVCKLFKQDIDCTIILAQNRAEEIDLEMKSNNITHVISFIGRTHGIYNGEVIPTIDYLEKPEKLRENINDNLYSPLILAMYCKEHNIHFTYLGTGCIFDYENIDLKIGLRGFTEESLPNFFGSSYSIVKGFTDRIMHTLPVLNIRIRMPITSDDNDRNFISKIIRYKKVCSMFNSMTVLDELIPVIIDLVNKKYIGTINLTNPGLISHNEILTMYRDIVDPTFTWENFTIEEQNTILLSKRSNNYLNTTLLESLYPDISNIKVSVRNILNNFK